MKIQIFRIDKNLPIPEYKTIGAVGFDLYAREKVIIKPHSLGMVNNNIIVKIPRNYMLLIASRSSTANKKGLMLANGVGIIDQDYHGAEDEIKSLFFNFTDKEVIIEKGERLSQGVFVRVDQTEFEEIDLVESVSRGGFGSTGHE